MIGLTIAHYKITEQLGEGSSGIVYKAQDLKRKRVVAIKALPNHLFEEERECARLAHEAKTAMSLEHPSICAVQNVIETEKYTFVVMNYVAGRTLSDVIDGFPLEFTLAIDYAVQIVSALYAAHESNIYHRDLRPANVIITNVGGARITDFGLGRLSERARTSENENAPQAVAYMSPEQIERGEVDQQSDIWSVGVILYEMIAGRRPFKGAEKVIMIDSILNDEPMRLIDARPDTPAAIQAIVDRSIAKNWENRYHTTEELLNDLKAVQKALLTGAAMPVSGPEPPPKSRLEFPKVAISLPKKPPMPKWKVVWIAVAAVFVALAAIVFLKPGAEDPFSARDWAVVADLDNLTGEDLFNGSFDVALTAALEQSRFVNVVPRRRAEASLARMKKINVVRIDVDVARAIAQRERSEVVIIPALRSAGESYRLSGEIIHPQTGEVLYSQYIEVKGRNKVLGAIDELARMIRVDLGERDGDISDRSVPVSDVTSVSLSTLRHYATAADHLRHGDLEEARLGYLSAVLGDSVFAIALAELGMLEFEHFDRSVAADYVDRANDLAGRVSERRAFAIRAGYATVVENNLEVAAQVYRSAVDAYPDGADNYARLAAVYSRLGRHEAAVEQYKEAIRVETTMSIALDGLASEYLEHLGRVDYAIQWLRRQMTYNPQDVQPYYNLAYACVGADSLDEAALALEQALAIDPEYAAGLELLGHVYRMQGRYPDAVAVFDRQFRADKENVAAQYNMGVVYQKMGKTTHARDSYDRFRQIAQWRSEDNPGEASYLFDLGLVLQRMGQKNGAAKAASRAAAIDSTAYLEWARLKAVQGRTDESLEQLRRAIDGGFRDLILLKYHPDFQAVRDDPRLAELLDEHLKS
jgi:tetratricopeptide (TPR) repeat protein/tRNA A-37 threonylcarbamoyl transferase component Bud32